MNQSKEAKQRSEIARLTQKLEDLTAQRKILVRSLEEIRDIALISDGVEFYAMLADKALTEANR